MNWNRVNLTYLLSLHSNLVIFKYNFSRSCHFSLLSLHSNLVIFKCNTSNDDKFNRNFTFQSGYIQIDSHTFENGTHKTLHSNLVIFKYHRPTDNLLTLLLYIPIWLYSNSFLFYSQRYIRDTLHSNLVIFKFRRIKNGRWKIYSFTFQSGYIQMDTDVDTIETNVTALHSNLVIFKYF